MHERPRWLLSTAVHKQYRCGTQHAPVAARRRACARSPLISPLISADPTRIARGELRAIALQDFLEKSSDAGLLRKMIETPPRSG